MRSIPFYSLITFLWLSQSYILSAQTKPLTLYGVVLNSTSNQPVPFVAIQVKSTSFDQSSNKDGFFTISCLIGDTLIFSRLGYEPYVYTPNKDKTFVKIILIENAVVLKDVIIKDEVMLPNVDGWKIDLKKTKKIRFENATLTQPTPGIMPIFGPGVIMIFGSNINNKLKRKLKEAKKTELYYSTLNSEEVKNKIITLCSISEETYYRKLAAFEKEYPEAAYLTKRDEIISKIIRFIAFKSPSQNSLK